VGALHRERHHRDVLIGDEIANREAQVWKCPVKPGHEAGECLRPLHDRSFRERRRHVQREIGTEPLVEGIGTPLVQDLFNVPAGKLLRSQ
jgi:hypothetical protein